MIITTPNQLLLSEKSPESQPKTSSIKNHKIYKANLNNHKLRHEIKKRLNAKDWTWYSFDFLNKGDAVLRRQRRILTFSKNMQKLELIYFTSVVTDKGFSYLSQVLKRLDLREFHFRLSASLAVTDKGLHYLGQSLRQMKNLRTVNLSFQGRFNMTDEGIRSLSEAFSTLLCLESVDLCFLAWRKITDTAISHLFLGLKELKGLERFGLDFSKCDNITDQGMKYVGELLKKLGNRLQKVKLEFADCEKITAVGIEYLCEGVENLRLVKEAHINLSENEQMMSDEGLEKVIRSLGRLEKLKEVSLNFGGCRRITRRGRKKAQRALEQWKFSSLEKIDLNFVEEVSVTEMVKRKVVKMVLGWGMFLFFACIVMYFIAPKFISFVKEKGEIDFYSI